MEDTWLTRAKRLHALASTGLHFGESDFDRERYQEIADIAAAMISDLGQVPLARLQGLFPDFAKGYATPKIDVRAAVISNDQVLLVREKVDQLWTLPGGYADVGLSAAENTRKEVREEACIDVSVDRLIGVFHKAKHEYRQDVRDFYKFYFLCSEKPGRQQPSAGSETLDARYFPLDALPALSQGRTIERHIQLAFEHFRNPALPVVFD